jgi:hypothetical protein
MPKHPHSTRYLTCSRNTQVYNTFPILFLSGFKLLEVQAPGEHLELERAPCIRASSRTRSRSPYSRNHYLLWRPSFFSITPIFFQRYLLLLPYYYCLRFFALFPVVYLLLLPYYYCLRFFALFPVILYYSRGSTFLSYSRGVYYISSTYDF